jgi:16S rRNA (cytidine1402-2'-O)-methyltransferase
MATHPHHPHHSIAAEAQAAEPTSDATLRKPAPGLHVVATPIGNAEDITLRALATLKGVAAIVCEDTRVTSKLLARHGIRAPLLAYHEHNAAEMRPKLLARLAAGEALALLSDAGTPLVSDPGYKLVRDAIDGGLAVTHLPGPSAVLTALVLSGLPSDRFLFAGFPPPKQVARRSWLGELASVPATLIFYETAPRLADSLADMASVLGDRGAAVARELTKLFEEVRRDTLEALAAHYDSAGPPKGEIAIVVGPPLAPAAATAETIDQQLRVALRSSSVRDAAAAVAIATGWKRQDVYARALALAGKS